MAYFPQPLVLVEGRLRTRLLRIKRDRHYHLSALFDSRLLTCREATPQPLLNKGTSRHLDKQDRVIGTAIGLASTSTPRLRRRRYYWRTTSKTPSLQVGFPFPVHRRFMRLKPATIVSPSPRIHSMSHPCQISLHICAGPWLQATQRPVGAV